MNAPHPFRTQFGALAVAAEPLPSASEAIGRLESSLTILNGIAESALTAAHQLERATIAGGGQRDDMDRLEDVAAKLAVAARQAEDARARVSEKLARAAR